MKFETPRILPSDITSRDLFLDRRRVLRYAAAGAAFGALGAGVSGRALGATIAAPGATHRMKWWIDFLLYDCIQARTEQVERT